LFQGFRLRYDPNVIFKRDDLTDSGAVDGLRVRENESDHTWLVRAGYEICCFHCAKISEVKPTKAFPRICTVVTIALEASRCRAISAIHLGRSLSPELSMLFVV